MKVKTEMKPVEATKETKQKKRKAIGRKILTSIACILLAVVLFLLSGVDLADRALALMNIPAQMPENGKVLDLSGYELTFSDEFDGDEIDTDKWNVHDEPAVRKGAYWTKDMLSVKDGALHITTKYVDGLGWCCEGIDTRGKFEQTQGYFELRCKLSKGTGLWSAFWLMNDNMTNIDSSGEDGVEVDIMEAAFYKMPGDWKNMVSHDIHYDGYGTLTQRTTIARKFIVEGNPYEEYHTYGFEWTDDEYTFYIDGKESMSTDFGGICKVPEYLLLSTEVYGDNLVPTDSLWAGDKIDSQGLDFVSDFDIDYVRVYAKK